jgi:hypothetical protein
MTIPLLMTVLLIAFVSLSCLAMLVHHPPKLLHA